MKTPICDFVNEYSKKGKLRLHMPGHKGNAVLGVENLDITEIDGADVLYNAKGIIKQSEENAALLFGTRKTVYSAEGSSLSIRAMLYLAMLYAKEQGKAPVIAAGRNAHKVFMTAAALLGIEIEWIFPNVKDNLLSCEITAENLEKLFDDMPQKPAAVYITSPDYLGNIADIRGISQVCKKHGALLLVDNAHGAYLNFLPESRHPMALGADICCDSAHKTLPVLTGGAYLHISGNAPDMLIEQAENAMSLFASTSPSYLILQSLDAANAYLADGYREKLGEFINVVSETKKGLENFGYKLIGNEPLKLTVAPKSLGYTGEELAEILSDSDIECEFSDPDFTVMMLTPEIEISAIEKLEKVLCSIVRKEAMTEKAPDLPIPEKAMSAREAIFAPSEKLEIGECCGRILSSASINCPPAIPIAVCGEIIDEAAIRCFEYYGITDCRVVKNLP